MKLRIGVLIMNLVLLGGFGCTKPSQTQGDNSTAQSPDNNAQGNSSGSEGGTTQTRTAPEIITVPSGKVLTVQLADEVGSKVSQPGQSFGGSLARAVEVNGKVAVPAGAKVEGTVLDAKPLGHFAGGALLQLKLNSITVSGEQLPVQTATFTQTIKGKGKRTGVLAGGGAGLGALIGGLAGGGKGAAIGAVAGAGAGTAGAAYTGNKEIVLPAETAVSFTLSASLKIKK
jgi:hypothetical protein